MFSLAACSSATFCFSEETTPDQSEPSPPPQEAPTGQSEPSQQAEKDQSAESVEKSSKTEEVGSAESPKDKIPSLGEWVKDANTVYN